MGPSRRDLRLGPSSRPSHRDSRLPLLDGHLADPGLLHDSDQLSQPLRPEPVETGSLGSIPASAAPDRSQEGLGLLSEEREEQKLLFARCKPLRVLAQLVQLFRHAVIVRPVVRQELERAGHDRIDRSRRPPVAALDQVADLVHHDLPALRRKNMDEGLRAEHLADRRRERRPPALAPDLGQLIEHLVEAVREPLRAEVCIELGDEARRQLVLGGPHRDPRRERRHRLVSERRVDQLAGTPEGGNVDRRYRGRCPRAPARAPPRTHGEWRERSDRWRRQ